MKFNNIYPSKALDVQKIENIFNVYIDENNMYFYNILKSVYFPENMDPAYYTTYIVEPKEKRGHDRGYWIWEYPKAGRSYMVTADVARGVAADFSACQIIDIETLEQVGEYKGQLPTKEYARVLAAISTEYPLYLLYLKF